MFAELVLISPMENKLARLTEVNGELNFNIAALAGRSKGKMKNCL